MEILIGAAILFLILFFLASLSASFAGRRGGNPGVWFIIGFILGPLGLLTSLLVFANQIACPICLRSVKYGASRCSWCGEKLP